MDDWIIDVAFHVPEGLGFFRVLDSDGDLYDELWSLLEGEFGTNTPPYRAGESVTRLLEERQEKEVR